MFDLILQTAMLIFSISILGTSYRVVKGPSMPDRIIALDSIGIHFIGLVAIFSIRQHTVAFLDIILLLGILAFIGTISFAKFLERGEVIERDRNR